MIVTGIQKTDEDSVVVFNHSLSIYVVLVALPQNKTVYIIAVATLPPSVCIYELPSKDDLQHMKSEVKVCNHYTYFTDMF